MRTRQVADAEQERGRDLAPGEHERLLEELHPLVAAARVMGVEPLRERADLPQPLRILDGGLDLQPVADDAGVRHQLRLARFGESRDALDVEASERLAERVALLQDGEPRQARLVDLQDEPLEQPVVVIDREPVLVVVIGPVKRMPRCNVAVAHMSILPRDWRRGTSDRWCRCRSSWRRRR